MITTGRMAYGSVPHHEQAHRSRRRVLIRRTVLTVLVVVLLAGSAGWVDHNWRSFDTRTDSGLCHLLDDRC